MRIIENIIYRRHITVVGSFPVINIASEKFGEKNCIRRGKCRMSFKSRTSEFSWPLKSQFENLKKNKELQSLVVHFCF